MNIQQGNSFGNNSINDNGQRFGNTYQFNGAVNINYQRDEKVSGNEELYEKRKTLNIIGRWIVAMGKLIVDIVLGWKSLADGLLYKWGEAFLQSIDNSTSGTTLSLYLQMSCAVISLLITAYLVLSTFALTTNRWYSSLRRTGMSVYRIKPHRCPLCNSKTSIKYNRGNYIVCSQEKDEHRWPIYFPMNK